MPADDLFDEKKYTPEELELLREKVKSGGEIDPVPEIPDAPDISRPPKRKAKVPGTYENTLNDLKRLRPNELPIPGQHFVTWGSAHLDDIVARAVRRSCPMTEDEYAQREVAHTRRLLEYGLKNPLDTADSRTGRPGVSAESPHAEMWDRARRTEHYARWRYRGYVCGEVVSL